MRRHRDEEALAALEPRREQVRCSAIAGRTTVDPLDGGSFYSRPRCPKPGEGEPAERVECEPRSAEGERVEGEYEAASRQCFQLSLDVDGARDIVGAGFVRRGDTRLLVASESELHAVDLDVVRRFTQRHHGPPEEERTPSPSGRHAWTTPLAGRYVTGATWSGDYWVRIALVLEDDKGLVLLYGETDGRAEPPAWTVLPLPRRWLVEGVRPAMAWRAGAMRVALLLRTGHGLEFLEWGPMVGELERPLFPPPAQPLGGCVSYAWVPGERGFAQFLPLSAIVGDDGRVSVAGLDRGSVWLADRGPWHGLGPPSLVGVLGDAYIVSVEGRRGIGLTSVSRAPAHAS